jgi:dihydroorotate dehydrogenase (fumarate)
VGTSLAASGGVHTGLDAIKAVTTGANVVQMVSALLQRGPAYLETVRADMAQWMEEHGYTSLEQMRGSMNLGRCPNPAAFERANYARVLQTWFLVD